MIINRSEQEEGMFNYTSGVYDRLGHVTVSKVLFYWTYYEKQERELGYMSS